jgi:hypothetical protein
VIEMDGRWFPSSCKSRDTVWMYSFLFPPSRTPRERGEICFRCGRRDRLERGCHLITSFRYRSPRLPSNLSPPKNSFGNKYPLTGKYVPRWTTWYLFHRACPEDRRGVGDKKRRKAREKEIVSGSCKVRGVFITLLKRLNDP